jgi:hypothetical protein
MSDHAPVSAPAATASSPNELIASTNSRRPSILSKGPSAWQEVVALAQAKAACEKADRLAAENARRENQRRKTMNQLSPALLGAMETLEKPFDARALMRKQQEEAEQRQKRAAERATERARAAAAAAGQFVHPLANVPHAVSSLQALLDGKARELGIGAAATRKDANSHASLQTCPPPPLSAGSSSAPTSRSLSPSHSALKQVVREVMKRRVAHRDAQIDGRAHSPAGREEEKKEGRIVHQDSSGGSSPSSRKRIEIDDLISIEKELDDMFGPLERKKSASVTSTPASPRVLSRKVSVTGEPTAHTLSPPQRARPKGPQSGDVSPKESTSPSLPPRHVSLPVQQRVAASMSMSMPGSKRTSRRNSAEKEVTFAAAAVDPVETRKQRAEFYGRQDTKGPSFSEDFTPFNLGPSSWSATPAVPPKHTVPRFRGSNAKQSLSAQNSRNASPKLAPSAPPVGAGALPPLPPPNMDEDASHSARRNSWSERHSRPTSAALGFESSAFAGVQLVSRYSRPSTAAVVRGAQHADSSDSDSGDEAPAEMKAGLPPPKPPLNRPATAASAPGSRRASVAPSPTASPAIGPSVAPAAAAPAVNTSGQTGIRPVPPKHPNSSAAKAIVTGSQRASSSHSKSANVSPSRSRANRTSTVLLPTASRSSASAAVAADLAAALDAAVQNDTRAQEALFNRLHHLGNSLAAQLVEITKEYTKMQATFDKENAEANELSSKLADLKEEFAGATEQQALLDSENTKFEAEIQLHAQSISGSTTGPTVSEPKLHAAIKAEIATIDQRSAVVASKLEEIRKEESKYRGKIERIRATLESAAAKHERELASTRVALEEAEISRLQALFLAETETELPSDPHTPHAEVLWSARMSWIAARTGVDDFLDFLSRLESQPAEIARNEHQRKTLQEQLKKRKQEQLALAKLLGMKKMAQRNAAQAHAAAERHQDSKDSALNVAAIPEHDRTIRVRDLALRQLKRIASKLQSATRRFPEAMATNATHRENSDEAADDASELIKRVQNAAKIALKHEL